MRFHLPSALRRWAGGNEIVEMSLPLDVRMTVSEAILMLGRDYPAIRQRVLDDQNEIRRHVNVFVDGENVRYTQGGVTHVSNDSEIWIYPALSGGCGCRFDDRRMTIDQKSHWGLVEVLREDKTTRISKNHLGISFEVWNSQQSWFWFVENTKHNGMIGAAASESEAEREACSSIEELASPSRAGREGALGDLAGYLACCCNCNANA
jgi:sulfur-carrier protein